MINLLRVALITNILFFNFSELRAREVIRPVENLSKEMSYLLQSIQSKELLPNQFEQLKRTIQSIDTSIQVLEKNSIIFLFKNILLKEILIKASSYPKSIKNLESVNFKSATLKISPFTRWLRSAVSTDIQRIKDKTLYQEYKKRVLSGKSLLIPKFRRLHKKITLLRKVTHMIGARNIDDFELNLSDFLNETLDSLKSYALTLEKTTLKPKTSAQLVYFEVVNINTLPLTDSPKKEVNHKKIVSVPEVIDSAQEELSQKIKIKSKLKKEKAWIPKEQGNRQHQNILKRRSDYIPPDELPKARNDWLIDL